MSSDMVMIDWHNLPEQFILCRDARHIPEGWPAHAIQAWHLGHHPSLPVTTLCVRDVPVGWMLGYAISGEGVLLDTDAVEIPAKALLSPEEFEHWVYEHGGRFVAVLITDLSTLVYIDPIGSLSVVYCPALEVVASTVTVVPRAGDTGELTTLARMVGIPKDSMYPLQYTPRKNVWRLIPNHVLDIKRWQVSRHWPNTAISLVEDVSGAVNEVVERVRLHVGALVTKKPVLLRLTAGLDSRMLLACARPWVDRLTVCTAEHEASDEVSWLDCSTATIMARRLGLAYMRLRHRRA